VSSTPLPQPADSDDDELARIANDPGMRLHARRMAGDLAEDVLQETWYLVAQASRRRRIENLRGYFYVTLVNTSRRMREELGRGPMPVDDPDTVAGATPFGRDYRDAAVPSAESTALRGLGARARRDRFWQRRAELWPSIPANSPDPERYRAVIFAVAEAVLVGGGPATWPEINDALKDCYPQWFDAPGVKPATLHQRRCRARESIRLLILAVIGRDDLVP
jgi:DNA-directed RNA polymerase specialized sigma24 family protein